MHQTHKISKMLEIIILGIYYIMGLMETRY